MKNLNLLKALALVLAVGTLTACGGGSGGGGGPSISASSTSKGKPLPGPGGVKAAHFPDDGGTPSTGGPGFVFADTTSAPPSGTPGGSPGGGNGGAGKGGSGLLALASNNNSSPIEISDAQVAAPTFAGITPTIAANPEPATALLGIMGLGSLALGATRRPARAR